MLAHAQSLFGRSNHDAFWENESKIHEKSDHQEDVWKSFFRKLAGCGISQLHCRLTSSLIAFRDFKYPLRFYRLRMATARSIIKCLKNTYKKFFTLSGGWSSVTCTWNKMLYKRGVLKNFSKLSDQQNKQSYRGVLSKEVLKRFVKFSEKPSLPKSLF